MQTGDKQRDTCRTFGAISLCPLRHAADPMLSAASRLESLRAPTSGGVAGGIFYYDPRSIVLRMVLRWRIACARRLRAGMPSSRQMSPHDPRQVCAIAKRFCVLHQPRLLAALGILVASLAAVRSSV